MPTRIHDTQQQWIKNETAGWLLAGSLTRAEYEILDIAAGSRFENFQAPYSASSKEPDLCICPNTQPLPQIVIETGWPESWPRLHQDADLWDDGRVASAIELFGRDSARNVRLQQTERPTPLTPARSHLNSSLRPCERPKVCQGFKGTKIYGGDLRINMNTMQQDIFPVPITGAPQTLPITRRQLFGAYLLAGRNGNDGFQLSVENLRAIATQRIQAMGLTPA
ncbi:predicted protein [Uncinocarpus reesii 1704]|uniref:Uncharacterized protein n=1 Tax=Uncinocarpus reesii (strain UAMH 1704) TaxID=336963 RepID=C4JRC7_UNCRE|nr:uncharacterized protein UREG_05016 [Uncinocarpus reesii 1704]EEP80174.1 predicted protein [Uncinocarpus reesii 1704]